MRPSDTVTRYIHLEKPSLAVASAVVGQMQMSNKGDNQVSPNNWDIWDRACRLCDFMGWLCFAEVAALVSQVMTSSSIL